MIVSGSRAKTPEPDTRSIESFSESDRPGEMVELREMLEPEIAARAAERA